MDGVSKGISQLVHPSGKESNKCRIIIGRAMVFPLSLEPRENRAEIKWI